MCVCVCVCVIPPASFGTIDETHCSIRPNYTKHIRLVDTGEHIHTIYVNIEWFMLAAANSRNLKDRKMKRERKPVMASSSSSGSKTFPALFIISLSMRSTVTYVQLCLPSSNGHRRRSRTHVRGAQPSIYV